MNRKNVLHVLCLLMCAASTSIAQSRRNSPAPPHPPVRNTDPPLPKPRVDVSGKLEGANYTNTVLGFTLTLPQGWQAQDKDVQQQLAEKIQQRTEEKLQGVDPAMKRATQESVARSTLLFIVIKPAGEKTNPYITGIAENVALMFNVRTPRQYLESMVRTLNILKASPMEFESKITEERIGNADFAYAAASFRDQRVAAATHFQQRYYVTIRRNHALGFILNYHSPEELKACIEVLNAVKFQ